MRAAWPLWAAVAALGCSSVERGGSDFPDLDQGLSEADGGRRDAGGRDGGPATMLTAAEGQWALIVEDRRCLQALGTSTESIVWSTFKVDVEEVSEDALQIVLRQRVELCGQELSPLIGGLQTVVPRALIDAVAVRYLTGFLLGREPGDIYFTAELVDLWGARDLTPTEALPTDPEDPRVTDQDGDGRPGVTFLVANRVGEPACDVQVVQRTRYRFSGTIDDGTLVSGLVDSTIDKVVLSASSGICGAENTLPPSPAGSSFVLIRVDGRAGGLDLDLDGSGAVSCAELRDTEDVLLEGGAAHAIPDDSHCR